MPKYLITALLLLLLIAIVVGFAALNATPVDIDYLLGTTTMPLPWVLLLALSSGFVLGLLVMVIAIFRARGEVRRMRKERRAMEAELKNLRSLPLRNS
ncbi:MAG: LapA family protein [Gammaproteobacteria bacterium]|nr:LapA family protein [Gammaproteobacteria bacterium]